MTFATSVATGTAVLATGVCVLAWADSSGSPEPVSNVADTGGTPGFQPSSILRVEMFSDLPGMSRASDLIVVGTVVDQQRFPDHDDIATLTTVEVLDTLKGEAPEMIEVYGMGVPPGQPDYSDIPEVADPPQLGETYVFHLASFYELTNAEGELVPRDNLWRPIQFGQYRLDSGRYDARGNGDLTLEDTDLPDDIPRHTTMDEIVEAATGA